jgi:hypothetical protein
MLALGQVQEAMVDAAGEDDIGMAVKMDETFRSAYSRESK